MVHESFKFPESFYKPILQGDITEKTKDEYRDPWHIISLEIEIINNYTPQQVYDLGKYLIALSKRVRKQYTASGKIKVKK